MRANGPTTEKLSRTPPMDCLTNRRRRYLLQVLVGSPTSMTERELAEEVVSATQGTPVDGVVDEEIRSAHINLRHIDLPKLSEAGLLTWNEGDGTVTPADHPILDDPRFEVLLLADDDQWVHAIADERGRDILSALESQDEPFTRAELAREIVPRDADGERQDEMVDSMEIQLHHVHLPRLEEAGLIEYDAAGDTVAYRGPADILDLASMDETAFEWTGQGESNPSIKIP